jgi:hypothetical protein
MEITITGPCGCPTPAVPAAQSVELPEELSQILPNEVLALLGEPPLFATESAAQYYQLLAAVAVSLQPRDYAEWVWVRDFVMADWELRRRRAAMTAMLEDPRERLWHKRTQWLDTMTAGLERRRDRMIQQIRRHRKDRDLFHDVDWLAGVAPCSADVAKAERPSVEAEEASLVPAIESVPEAAPGGEALAELLFGGSKKAAA